MKGRILGVGAACLLAATQASAQLSLSPRMVGTAGSYVAMARGQDAVHLNPANLALSGNPRWSLALAQVGISGSTFGPSFSDFGRLLVLGEDDGSDGMAEFLDRIPAGGLEVDMEVRVPVATLQVGRLAFGVSYTGVMQQTLDRDFVDLLLNSYENGRTNYSVGNTVGSRATYVDFAAAYAQRVGPVAVGVTGRYLHGGSMARSRLFDPRYNRGSIYDPIEIDYLEVYSQGGRGFALDVGAAYEPLPRLTVSGAVSNLVSSVRWSDELWVRDVTLGVNDLDFVEMADRFRGSERPLGSSNQPDGAAALAAGLHDDATLPTTLRVGASYAPASGTRVGVSYQKAGESRLSSGWSQSVGVGVQQRLAIFGLRAGMASNMDGGSMVGGGISVGPLDVSAANITGESADASRSGLFASIGLSVRGGLVR